MPRRLIFIAISLVALLVAAAPAAAGKGKRASLPTVKTFSPTKPELGGTLTLLGRRYAKKRARNTVILRAPSGGSKFLKPKKATRGKLVVRLPGALERLMRKKNGKTVATRFRVRVLAGKKFGPWTKKKRSPVIRPSGSGGPGSGAADCDNDGSPNSVDADDDNDLLTDTIELQIKTDVCVADTDLDGIEDGFEYESALNLNNDEDQEPNTSLPYPGKRPYPNPLDPSDIDKDFDGDSLQLFVEYKLWKYAIARGQASRTISPLFYSDGEKYSVNERVQGDRRRPALPVAGYARQIDFLNWASGAGYRTVMLADGPPWWEHEIVRHAYGLLDFNKDGVEAETVQPGFFHSERYYYDKMTTDGFLEDGERDEDSDGLTNVDEVSHHMSPTWWGKCYEYEAPFKIAHEGTDVVDPDTDGDGVRDGADDQDHDDIPNIMELSRNAASGLWDGDGQECKLSPELGASNFELTGGPLPNNSVTVTFVGELGRQNVPQMTASAALTGGTAPGVTITTFQQGSSTADEKQRVTITGGPDGGSFTLTLGSSTTGSIAFDASAEMIQTALDELVPPNEDSNHPSAYGRVNPFNPCLPSTFARGCPTLTGFDGVWAPFDGSLNWAALN